MNCISIWNLLFKKNLKEYVALDHSALALNNFDCYTFIDNEKHILTGKETIICLEPLQICIIDNKILPDKIDVFYSYKNRVTASVSCTKRSDVEMYKPVQIYFITDTALKHYSLLSLLIYYYKINRRKNEHIFKNYLSLAGLFFYPRKVILVSAACDNFLSIFPMDFQVQNTGGDIILLGLRKSNKTNEFTGNKNLKLSIADFGEANKEDAYTFGKFHTTTFPNLEELPYNFIKTETHHSIFPDFIKGYKELELLNCIDIGLQNLFICRVIHASNSDVQTSDHLYHLHYLAIHE